MKASASTPTEMMHPVCLVAALGEAGKSSVPILKWASRKRQEGSCTAEVAEAYRSRRGWMRQSTAKACLALANQFAYLIHDKLTQTGDASGGEDRYEYFLFQGWPEHCDAKVRVRSGRLVNAARLCANNSALTIPSLALAQDDA